ncbi:TIGR04283 family arsenosugar biosynthesis glycosyltransferase [Gillisia sp. JM1]|uniref:TIGR04283 family arsenosugar biosynthesis glycosyltransferase n=1 Tax=Gillisia sp. JM1 TaxID=1283286 RepID=UPI00047ED636|nr:TIGR04283 family arsenosugar biosynthesis glycosyltransferase [Gillisia sp. JM1]
MVSIIIPCYNEANYIEATLKQCFSQIGDLEIIVVDGGSTDYTTKIVENYPSVVLISSIKGRSNQLNKGAETSKGSILLFLHADTLLPPKAIVSISKAFKNEQVVGGSFYLEFDKYHVLLFLYSMLSKINHSFFTYGDHGIFISKQVFSEIGGFKNVSFMEDAEIQKSARKKGKFLKLNLGVKTSTRRFEKHGFSKQFFQDMLIAILFKLGVDPEKLKRYYPDHS